MPKLEEVLKNLQCDILNLIADDLTDYIKNVIQEKVYSEVYDKYEETRYPRRYENEGLGDISLYEHELVFTSSGVIIRVKNNTLTDDKTDYLDKYIIEGDKYSWKNSRIYKMQPYKRDFIDATMKQLVHNRQIQNIIKTKLKTKGLKVN